MKKTISLFMMCLMVLFSGCSKPENLVIPIDEVMTKIQTEIELPSDMMNLESVDQLKSYYGIEKELVKDFSAVINSSGVEQDEIVIIEAVDKNAVKEIETALNKRLESKKNQMKNYLPEQYKILTECSVKTYSNYVVLFISKDVNKMNDILNTYIK